MYWDSSLCLDSLDIRVVKEHLTKELPHTGRIIASLERLVQFGDGCVRYYFEMCYFTGITLRLAWSILYSILFYSILFCSILNQTREQRKNGWSRIWNNLWVQSSILCPAVCACIMLWSRHVLLKSSHISQLYSESVVRWFFEAYKYTNLLPLLTNLRYTQKTKVNKQKWIFKVSKK